MDIGWSELLLVGIVALIVIGPKDLPRMFAALGRFTAKARAMGREFQRAMDEAARESGVAETASDLRAMTSKKSLGLDKIEEAAKKFESWDPVKSARAATKSPAPAAAPGSETAKLAEERAAAAEARRSAATGAPAATPQAGAKPAAADGAAAKAPAPAKAPAAAKAKAPAKARAAGKGTKPAASGTAKAPARKSSKKAAE